MAAKNSKELKSWQELAMVYRSSKITATKSVAAEVRTKSAQKTVVAKNTDNSADLNYFAAAMKNVQPLRANNRVYLPPPPKQRIKMTATVSAPPISDEMDISSYLTEYNALPGFCRHRGDTNLLKKLYSSGWSVQSNLDLHGLTVVNARLKFSNWLTHCLKRQLRCVLVIHGVGYHSQQPAKLNRLVKVWAVQCQQVMAFIQAPANLGGEGATLILLKKNRITNASSQK